jgi:4,5-DOPA dioxygenase extradiol
MKFNELNNFRYGEKMPVLFVGHGSPMNAIEDNQFVRTWKEMGKSLPKPNAILCISAHWETQGTHVTSLEKPMTIHDFGGFPRKLFEVQYPAPGSPELAAETKRLIKMTEVGFDEKWGFDHGSWSVIKNLYPEADVPVIQLSLDYSKTPQYHYDLAKELSALREKGVLIIGSGNIVHNLGMIAWDKLDDADYSYDWAREAKEKIKGNIMNGDHQSLINYNLLGRELKMAVPSPEHYLPLLYVLALKNENEKASFFNDSTVGGSLAMTSVKIERI